MWQSLVRILTGLNRDLEGLLRATAASPSLTVLFPCVKQRQG